MKQNKAIAAILYRTAGFLISTAGIVLHMFSDNIMESGFMIRHKLAYFTIQTNVAVAGLFLFLMIRSFAQYRRDKTWSVATICPAWHGALTLYITITMLGFWLLLAPTTGLPKNSFLFFNSFTLHAVTPLLAIFDFIWFCPHGKLNARHGVWWLSYPVGYLLFVMLYSTTVKEPYYSFRMGDRMIDLMYPYPFLDASVMGTWGVVGAVAVLAAVFYGLARLFIFLDRKAAVHRAKKQNP